MEQLQRKIGVVRSLMMAAVLCIGLVTTASAQTVTAEPFYRFYLTYPPQAQVHYYSRDKSVPADWNFEGVEGYLSPEARSYTVPLYRFYCDNWADHVYTANEPEANSLSHHVLFKAEGLAGHVVPAGKEIPGTVPLYRFTRTHKSGNRVYQDHFYSLNASVPAGYTAEGICCRVWPAAVSLPNALLTLSAPAASAKWARGSVQKIDWALWTGGGVVRISYSVNGGQSWSAVADVPASQSLGSVLNGSYDWKLPANLTGSIRVKLDWFGQGVSGMALPLVSVQSGNITVVPAPPNVIRR